ncbi:hypothetical protein Tco_0916538, partial [Tanacetum coccineum]
KRSKINKALSSETKALTYFDVLTEASTEDFIQRLCQVDRSFWGCEWKHALDPYGVS